MKYSLVEYSRPFHRAALCGKESPGNTEHHTPEMGDTHESIALQQKITVPKFRDKGEKVG